MNKKLNKYKSFGTLEEAKAYKVWLAENDIPSQIEDNSPQLSPIFIGDSLQDNFFIKIREIDFERANEIYSEKVSEEVEHLPEDYFLHDFNDKELIEILDQPENWDEFNIHAALKILRDRGVDMDPNVVEDIKIDQLLAQSKVEKISDVYIILFYCLAVVAGFLGMFVGNYLQTSRKTLRDGNVIFRYIEPDRKHGKRIFILGLIQFSIFFCYLIGSRIKATL